MANGPKLDLCLHNPVKKKKKKKKKNYNPVSGGAAAIATNVGLETSGCWKLVSLVGGGPYNGSAWYPTMSKLSWRDRIRGRKGIHLTENGSNKRHVILMGVNARAHYQMTV